jgi:hypothetical protein
LKAHKYCPACDLHTHVINAKKNNGLCPGCQQPFPAKVEIVKPTEVETGPRAQRPPTEAEQNLTKGQQGYRACACGKFSSVARKVCWNCETEFVVKQPKVNKAEVSEAKPPPTPTLEEWETYRGPDPLAPEILNDIEGYFISDEIREKYVIPFGTSVLPYTESKPAFSLDLNHPGVFPSDGAILRWSHELRAHMLGFHRTWITNGCLFNFLVQQFKGIFEKDSEEMQWAKLILSELPDVHKVKTLVLSPA